MALDKNALVQEIRCDIGSPLESEIDNSVIEKAIDKAVARYSQFSPKKEYRVIHIQPNKQSYNVPDDVVDVTEVVYALHGICGFSRDVYADLSVFDNPSLLSILLQKIEHYAEMMGNWWEYADGVLTIPLPSSSGLLLYEASLNRTLADIPAKHYEIFKDYIRGECMLYMGRKRNKKVTKVPTMSGTIEFDSGIELRAEGYRLQRKFEEAMGANCSAVIIG